jgi:hypothetical protein
MRVTQDGPPPKTIYLSPEDIQQWLRQEISDSAKALELRVKEASEFVTAYAAGKITPAEAEEKHWRYQHRWGEALPGVHSGENITDQQILRAIDKAQGEYSTPSESRAKYKRTFGRLPGQGGAER